MQDLVEARNCRGAVETHLTMAAQDADFANLQTLATELAGRFLLHIVLPRGRAPSQPMLSWRDQGGAGAGPAAVRALAAG